jgi:hypothetical protein
MEYAEYGKPEKCDLEVRTRWRSQPARLKSAAVRGGKG